MSIMAKYFSNKPMMINTNAISLISKTQEIQVFGNSVVIPICGILTKYTDVFFCTTSYEEIYENIAEAVVNPSVEQIVLDIDSPGGEVSGLFDLCDFISQAKLEKPIVAYANDSCFSAAYAIAASCSKVLVNRTSGVGSIGVIATHLDISEYDKKEGLKYTTIFKGAKKNDLNPHEPLTSTAFDSLNRELDRLYEMFVELVAKGRNISTAAVMATEAGIFYGENAVKAGLADEITNDFKTIKNTSMEKPMKIEAIKEENSEELIENSSRVDAYKAEVEEIARLCKLAKMPEKLAEFIEAEVSVNDARDLLLKALASKTEDIRSTISMNNKAAESPVVAAAKSRN